MKPTDQDPFDEDLTSLLASYDDALASGHVPDELPLPDTSLELQVQLNRDLTFVEKVRATFGSEKGKNKTGVANSLSRPSSPSADGHSQHETSQTLGRFHVLRELGRGGYGVVYLAYDPLLERNVALKVPRAEIMVNASLKERFYREARAAAGLSHPNLVPVYEAGAIGPICFLISAYIPGSNLAQWLKERTHPLPFSASARLTAQLAQAIDHAHAKGILHRDLKPANILLERAEGGLPSDDASTVLDHFLPRITDFGLAKLLVEADQDLTHSGAVVGTVCYMAPEQAVGKNKDIGPQADVYALGAILYELLTGRPPFQGETDLDTLVLVRSHEAIPPSRFRPSLPRDLETICLKCLQKDPRSRYATARSLAEDLNRYLEGRPISARPGGLFEQVGRWSRRNPSLALMSSLAAGAVLAVVGVSLWFAFYEQAASEKLKGEQDKTKTALVDAQDQYHLSRRQAALLKINQALGRPMNRGYSQRMLYFAQSLETITKLPPEMGADLEHMVGINLAAWSNSIRQRRNTMVVPAAVCCLTFSKDGKYLVAGCKDGSIQGWAVKSGAPLGPPLRLGTAVQSMVFSSQDGQITVVDLDQTLSSWNLPAGRRLTTATISTPKGCQATLGPDGRLCLTCESNGMLQIWDVASGERAGSPWKHQSPAWSAAWSADSKRIITGCADGSACLWDVASGNGTLREAKKIHDGPISAVAFDSFASVFATGGEDRAVRLWNGPWNLIAQLEHHGRGNALTFSLDGQNLLTGCFDGNARVFDAASGQLQGEELAFSRSVGAVAFSPDGSLLATGSDEGAVHVCSAVSCQPAGIALPHEGAVLATAFSQDGRFAVTACADHFARIWDFSVSPPRAKLLPHAEPVHAVSFCPTDQNLFLTATPHHVCFWDPCDGKQCRRPIPLETPIVAGLIRWSSDGRLLWIAGTNSQASLWDALKGEQIGKTMVHEGAITGAAFSPNGDWIVTTSADRTACLWNTIDLKKPLVLSHPHGVTASAFSPDGQFLVTGCLDSRARIWNVSSGKLLDELIHNGSVYDVAYSPDGRQVVSGSADNTARLWEPTTGNQRVLKHPSAVRAVTYSGDGKRILVATDNQAQMWDARTGFPLGPPLVNTDKILNFAFSPNGKNVLIGTRANAALLCPLTMPIQGDPNRLVLWTQIITGIELNADGAEQLLTVPAWLEKKRALDELGGPPIP